MFGRRSVELAQDSPTSSRDDGEEVISPLSEGLVSPPKQQKKEAKVMMMSTTDRESLSGRVTISKAPVVRKNQTWDQKCQTYCSLCMAMFLFAGGMTLFICGCVLISSSSDSHALGMIIVGIIMLIPGTYGMSKVVRFFQRRQAILHRAKQGHRHGRPSEELIAEAEEELV